MSNVKKKVTDPIKALVAKVDDYVASLVRTGVMLAIGWLLAYAGRHGLHMDVSQASLDSVATAAYYIAVRAMEHYVNPRFGWLLGLARKPQYEATPAPPVTEEPLN